ncbi:MAG TPA: cytochrome c3 family protein [Bacteroidia bacterium]|nr:cytochrome c3 family protein [Bacteroidia bacterium]
MKKLIVWGIILICIVLMVQCPHAMLNPGELIEGHQKLNEKCLDCHNPFHGIDNTKCISCHKLSDIGKDTTNLSDTNNTTEKILFHQNLSNEKCTSCHTDHKGIKPDVPVSSFTHELLSAAVINKCYSCHNQTRDSLHKQLTTDCSKCHTTNGWKSAVVFNHDLILGTGKNNCSSCHPIPRDSYHHTLKENCDKCHSTNKWVPSTFDHSAYFRLDKDHNVKCNVCHTNNDYSNYTCYGCHEHSPAKIRSEHIKEGISNFSDCTSCHKSSDEHDIRMNRGSGQELNQKEVKEVKDYIKPKNKDGKKEHKGEDGEDRE